MPEDPITITMTTPTPPPPGSPTRVRTRTDIAIGWAVGHVAELSGITVPLVVGAFTTAWLDLISAAVALWWAVHQFREHRVRADIARHTLTAASPTRHLPTTTTTAVPPHRESGHR